MRTNSPLDEGTQMAPEDLIKTEQAQPSEEEKMILKVANSPEWQMIVNYLKNRQEYYRAFLPGESNADGTPKPVASSMSASKLEEIGKKWVVATTIIGEIESWISQIENTKNAAKRRPIIR